MCRTCIPLIWPQINLMNCDSGSHQTVTCSLDWRNLPQVVNIIHSLGVLILQKWSTILLCVCFPWKGTRILSQGCTIVSWLLPLYLCFSSLSWKATEPGLWNFLGFKITADGDCSHEIKRRLLLGRKVMTNLDSTFKSRDITLPTKVHLV